MSLSDIIGQQKTIEMFLGILKSGRIAGSYLFCGEPGIGKKTAAVNFAKALNCRAETLDEQSGGHLHDACDICDSCVKIDVGSHPDIIHVAPEDGQIKIEEIRIVEEALSYRPFEGRMKVVIIDDAETMNISASNAFLKTLEEPSHDSLIILVSSNPDALPATIRSRCLRINFYTLSEKSLREVIRKIDPQKDNDLAVGLSQGRPGLVLSGDLVENREWFLGLFRGMLRAEKDGWASREDMELWFDHLMALLRDMSVLKITGNASDMINRDLGDYLETVGKQADLKVIINLYRELSGLRRLLLFNLNKSITWNYTAALLRKEFGATSA